jgi:hypothetical protein
LAATVTDNTYSQPYFDALNSFYQNYVVTGVDQSIQVFTSFTYGEMVISTLLFTLVLLFGFKWVWEVLR